MKQSESERYLMWVDRLLEDDDKLTPWEQDFCESIRERLEGGGELTDRQAESLEGIYEKRS